MTAPIVFLDTETDGVHPDREVWEIAMIRRDDAGQRETAFFVDIDLSTADPFGLKVGRFYERHPLGMHLSGADPGEEPYTSETFGSRPDGYHGRRRAALEVARWTHGAHIIGAVPNFDTEVLANLLRDNGLTPSWHYHLIDIEALAAGSVAGRWAQGRSDGNPSEPGPFDFGLPWKSDDLSRACGVEPPSEEERHTALGDARWAMRLYDAVIQQTGTS